MITSQALFFEKIDYNRIRRDGIENKNKRNYCC